MPPSSEDVDAINDMPRKEADERDEKKQQVAQHHVHTEDPENKYHQNAQKQTTKTLSPVIV